MQSLRYMSTEETTTGERTSHILQLTRRHEANAYRLLEARNARLLIQCPPKSLMLTTLIRTFSEWQNKESKPKVYKPFQKCVRRTLPNPTQPSPAQLIKVDWISNFHSRGNTASYYLPLPKTMCNQKSLSLSLSRQKTRATKIQLSSHTPHKHNLAPPCRQVRRKGKQRK